MEAFLTNESSIEALLLPLHAALPEIMDLPCPLPSRIRRRDQALKREVVYPTKGMNAPHNLASVPTRLSMTARKDPQL